MAKPVLKAIRADAPAGPFHTGTAVAETDGKTSKAFVFEADMETLAGASGQTPSIAAVVTSDYAVESSRLDPAGGGMGKLTIVAVRTPTAAETSAAVRSTLRIGMEEVQYDLEDHPYLAGARATILKWLATDETVREANGNYYWQSPDGAKHAIADATALKFIAAYMAGIRHFVRYYPVVDRISTWRAPPGMTQAGRSFTGGTPLFSAGLGGYDDPPATLSGYPAGNWFKSGDNWEENGNGTWTRREQWTYTPEAKTGTHGWTYTTLGTVSDGGGAAQGGGN